MKFPQVTAIVFIAFNFSFDASAQDALKPEAAKIEGVIDLKFDDLKFEMAKDAKFERKMLVDKIERLNGAKVKFTGGQIFPASVYQREGIKWFVLVSDTKKCGLPPDPLCELIRVEMVGEATAAFTTKPITVEGQFEIREWGIVNGRPMAVYHIKATTAK